MSTICEVVLDIKLTLMGPVLTASTQAGKYGVDIVAARNEDGKCYLPGTQIKGRLREALIELQDILWIHNCLFFEWFGTASKGKHNVPERGKLIFSDFVLENEEKHGRVQTRIAIDETTATVKSGAILTLDTPVAPGKPAVFEGTVSFFCYEKEMDRAIKRIMTGLRWIPAFGGQKSVGYGRLLSLSFKKTITRPPQITTTTAPAPRAMYITLQPDRPFCISKPRTDDNLFESEIHIPGSVIKGSIGSTLNALTGRVLGEWIDADLPEPWSKLGEHFGKLRFDFAFPALKGTKRPMVHALPLSIGRAKGKTKDFSLEPESKDVKLIDLAPSFQIDWKGKDYDEVWGKHAAWSEEQQVFPPKILRVRTAIEDGRAKESQLFAYEMVVPKYTFENEDPKEYIWHSRVDLSDVPEEDQCKVHAQLQALFDYGLRYLSKTKANVRMTHNDITSNDIDLKPFPNNCWVIVLQTPALILDPENGFNDALCESKKLHDLYQEFWTEISKRTEIPESTFTLKRFFAQQQMLGGHLHKRLKRGQELEPYNPFLLTNPGSVFVLEAKEEHAEQAKELLKEWLSLGLPHPQWAKDRYEKNGWQCPFDPRNGFGHILVNHAIHNLLK